MFYSFAGISWDLSLTGVLQLPTNVDQVRLNLTLDFIFSW
jgi:hypothetical protein